MRLFFAVVFVSGKLTGNELKRLAAMLANPLINRVHTKTSQEYGTKGMDLIVPAVDLH